MNQVNKLIFAFSFLLVSISNGIGQTEFGSYFLDGTWASRELNVSDTLAGNIEIYLPGIYLESHHSNKISLSDIISNSGDKKILSLSGLINQLEEENTFDNSLKVNTIGVGFKLNGFSVDVKHNLRLNSTINYPKELAKLIFEGNSQYIGETVSFGPAVDYYSFHEYSLGVSKSFGGLNIGARLKYLSGIGYVKTISNNASLYTDDDIYQLTFNTDYVLESSNTLDIEGVDSFNFDTDFTKQFFSSNNGVAFDLGISYQVNEALQLSASILDLGSISWKDQSSKYTSRGNFTYDGFDLDEFLLNDSVEFEVKLDTLEEVFAFTKSAVEGETTLGTKMYLAGEYKINDKINVGALIYSNDISFSEIAIGLNVQYRLGKSSRVGLNYGYRKGSFSNLGLQFASRLGPFVVFANTDNLISVFLNDNYNLNGRLGFGLSF